MNLREFPLLIFFSVGFIFLLLFFFPPRGHAHTHGVSSLRSCAAAPRGLKILITTNYSQTPRTFNGLFLTASSGLGATRFCTCHPPTSSSCIQARKNDGAKRSLANPKGLQPSERARAAHPRSGERRSCLRRRWGRRGGGAGGLHGTSGERTGVGVVPRAPR